MIKLTENGRILFIFRCHFVYIPQDESVCLVPMLSCFQFVLFFLFYRFFWASEFVFYIFATLFSKGEMPERPKGTVC